MIEKGKCCTNIMKKHFNKKLVKTTKDNEDFLNSTKCWICDNIYVVVDVKVRDHCYTTGKYRSFAHRGCNIKVK